jgi:two-component system chemotaxis response regulator CheB
MRAASPTRVIIADDDEDMRLFLERILSQHPTIKVVGTAADGNELLGQIPVLKPDVVTLDVFMPGLNGFEVLKRAAGQPVAFLMVSAFTRDHAGITLRAMEQGAFDYVAKPGPSGDFKAFRRRLCQKVLAASESRRKTFPSWTGPGGESAQRIPLAARRGWIVAIGISCGGPQTLMRMLPVFPADFAPLLIVQHMPADFTGAFAEHLNQVCRMKVRQAADHDRIEQGTALIAPGGRHMQLTRESNALTVRVVHGCKVSRHCPSADVLFDSVAATCGPHAVGVIMTGMGSDGAAGIARMNEQGAWTIAQDEETSIVFGMPQAAIQTGGIDHVVPVQAIPRTIARLMQSGARETQRVRTAYRA